MKVLLVSTCKEKLSEREFVTPISYILDSVSHQILHYSKSTREIVNSFDKIIICGTSLQDNKYRNDLDFFKELFYEFPGPILGICSGMQIVCSVFGSQLITNSEIGMVDVKTLEKNILSEGKFQVYNIHNTSVNNLDNFTTLAASETSVQIVKHKNKDIFGVSFHPEVRNENIVSNFLKI